MATGPAPLPKAVARNLENNVSKVLRRVVVPYAAVAALWILVSDSLVSHLFKDPAQITVVSTLKGWIFVAVTSMLLLVLVRRHSSKVAQQDAAIEQAHNENAFLSDLIERSSQPLAVAYPDGRIARCNHAFLDLVGYSEEEIRAIEWNRVLTPAEWRAMEDEQLQKLIRTGQPVRYEKEYLRKDGSRVKVELLTDIATDNAGRSCFYAFVSDITARKHAEQEIRHLAFYDPLTHLPNRRLALDRLQQAVTATARHKRHGALMLLDMDDFKMLNDTLGHDVGDQFLIEVARRLQACVREGDTVARPGGDEFLVILEDLHEDMLSAMHAESVAVKILRAVGQPYQLDLSVPGGKQQVRNYHCTSSIGITLIRDNSVSVDELMKRADTAMYQAKAAGRNTLRFFDPLMQSAVTARAALDNDLREAVRENQFLIHYQPQVDAAGRITGAEALVRWQHPERGLVSPAEFIPLAEETGLILPIGQWVLETACAQLVRWSAQPELAHLTLAVNVSARQFRHKDFVDQVMAVLDSSGAKPQRLKLELTESLLLDDIEDIIVKMGALKESGVGFSLDDFGTGYSSLSYLKRLPLDQLKIDQSFVRNVLTDANDAAIARTIVALAHSMGLAVIAEGVETDAQREFLAASGCHAYQGYFFGKPVPVEQFEQQVRQV